MRRARAADLTASMSQYLIDRIRDTKNVRVLPRAPSHRSAAGDRLEAHHAREHGYGARRREMDADALFIFIGTAPRTDMVAGLVERDPQGFILTGRDLLVDGKWPRTWNPDANRDPFLFETSVPGIFAAGDVAPRIRQTRRVGGRRRVRRGHGCSSIPEHGLTPPAASRPSADEPTCRASI